jgi:ribosomal protein S9
LAAPALLARGTGRRKEAVVRVRLFEGTGMGNMKGREMEDG